MPVLQAEESLSAVACAAIGSGLMDKGEQRRILGNWRRLASSTAGGGKPKRLTRDQAAVVLAGIGIGLERKAVGGSTG